MSHYYCVLDFEATCWNPQGKHRHEIIEFPSILLKHHPHSTHTPFEIIGVFDFCTNLTQSQIDNGISLQGAINQHQTWLDGCIQDPTAMVKIITFGDRDLLTCLPLDCAHKHIHSPSVYKRWINLKKEFRRLHPTYSGNYGLVGLLEFYGMKVEGHIHSGIDDCHNTVRLLNMMVIRDRLDMSQCEVQQLF
jgi:inhibitor of KinA sporulation pathway (predicted exonuclease)